MNIIEKILNHPDLIAKPPILLDIGASGAIHKEWETFAKYSICIAFDADDREMGFIEDVKSGYKKLIVYNSIVTDTQKNKMKFYLTKSPYCSSLLQPDNKSLEQWAFGDLFKVERNVNLKTVTLPKVLKELKIEKIDWFKTDSQGIDMRLFKSLGEKIIKKLLVADFEPGLIDAYKGEDKAYSLIGYMDKLPFWMSDMTVRGSKRINMTDVGDRLDKDELQYFPSYVPYLRSSPGWAEMSFINEFDAKTFEKRDYLLGFLFSYTKKQYGYCLHIIFQGRERFDDPIFILLQRHIVHTMKNKSKKRRFKRIVKKVLMKLSG